MLIRGKVFQFGIKIWCLNTANGYLVQFEPYGGKSTNGPSEQSKKEFGLSGSVVLGLCTVRPNLEKGNFLLFLDSYFRSNHLIENLKNIGILCSRTIICKTSVFHLLRNCKTDT